MKKKFFLLLLVFAFSVFPAQSFAAIIGNNYAQKDVNVRISPNATAKRIGHFKKGQKIVVKKIMGTWCNVEYKKYRNAYVYCPLLKNAAQPKNISQTEYPTIKAATLNEISLDYPKEWYVNTSDGLTLISNLHSESITSINTSIILTRTEYKSEIEAKKQAEKIPKDFKEIGLNLNLVSEEDLSIPVDKSVYKSTLIVLTSTMDPFSENYLIVTFAVKGKNIYTVFGISGKNDKAIEEVKSIIKTFKVK